MKIVVEVESVVEWECSRLCEDDDEYTAGVGSRRDCIYISRMNCVTEAQTYDQRPRTVSKKNKLQSVTCCNRSLIYHNQRVPPEHTTSESKLGLEIT